MVTAVTSARADTSFAVLRHKWHIPKMDGIFNGEISRVGGGANKKWMNSNQR